MYLKPMHNICTIQLDVIYICITYVNLTYVNVRLKQHGWNFIKTETLADYYNVIYFWTTKNNRRNNSLTTSNYNVIITTFLLQIIYKQLLLYISNYYIKILDLFYIYRYVQFEKKH